VNRSTGEDEQELCATTATAWRPAACVPATARPIVTSIGGEGGRRVTGNNGLYTQKNRRRLPKTGPWVLLLKGQ
jgi:hypothetical protein